MCLGLCAAVCVVLHCLQLCVLPCVQLCILCAAVRGGSASGEHRVAAHSGSVSERPAMELSAGHLLLHRPSLVLRLLAGSLLEGNHRAGEPLNARSLAAYRASVLWLTKHVFCS